MSEKVLEAIIIEWHALSDKDGLDRDLKQHGYSRDGPVFTSGRIIVNNIGHIWMSLSGHSQTPIERAAPRNTHTSCCPLTDGGDTRKTRIGRDGAGGGAREGSEVGLGDYKYRMVAFSMMAELMYKLQIGGGARRGGVRGGVKS